MNERQMMHGQDWMGQDLSGWLITEKLDGCRAYWDGETLWSRGGIAAKIPASWAKELPPVALDCELYDGIGGLYRCGAALRYGKFTPTMQLAVFDAPQSSGGWDERMRAAAQAAKGSLVLNVLSITPCASNAHAVELLAAVKAKGGEGLMARKPALLYKAGRTYEMLKVKMEATQ